MPKTLIKSRLHSIKRKPKIKVNKNYSIKYTSKNIII